MGQRGTGGRLSDSVAGIGDMWCRSRNRLPRWSAAAGVAVGQRRLHCGSGGRFGATSRMSSMKANVMPMMFVFTFFSMI